MQIGLLQISTEIYFVDEGFSLATPTLGGHMQYCAHNAILSCSVQTQAFLLRGELGLEPSQFHSLVLTNYTSQAGDACPLTKTMDIEGTYEGGPHESGRVHFETNRVPCCS